MEKYYIIKLKVHGEIPEGGKGERREKTQAFCFCIVGLRHRLRFGLVRLRRGARAYRSDPRISPSAFAEADTAVQRYPEPRGVLDSGIGHFRGCIGFHLLHFELRILEA